MTPSTSLPPSAFRKNPKRDLAMMTAGASLIELLCQSQPGIPTGVGTALGAATTWFAINSHRYTSDFVSSTVNPFHGEPRQQLLGTLSSKHYDVFAELNGMPGVETETRGVERKKLHAKVQFVVHAHPDQFEAVREKLEQRKATLQPEPPRSSRT